MLLVNVSSDEVIQTLLQRLAATRDGVELGREGLMVFFHQHMGATNFVADTLPKDKRDLLARRAKMVKKALSELVRVIDG